MHREQDSGVSRLGPEGIGYKSWVREVTTRLVQSLTEYARMSLLGAIQRVRSSLLYNMDHDSLAFRIMPWQFGQLNLTEDGGNKIFKYADALIDGVRCQIIR